MRARSEFFEKANEDNLEISEGSKPIYSACLLAVSLEPVVGKNGRANKDSLCDI